MKNTIYFALGLTFFLVSCLKEETPQPDTTYVNPDDHLCGDVCSGGSWIMANNGLWLYGGENEDWHFDISTWDLNESGLRFGLGRESFHALIEPEYSPLSDVTDSFSPTDEFIIVALDNGFYKTYPLGLMMKHEVINETFNGHPAMVAYCVLADLAIVYSRDYCENTLTFALSGYTYRDADIQDGREAFILWDRDTESLWWPLLHRAVSGDMNGTPLKEYSGDWEVITFDELQSSYDTEKVIVLQDGQTMEVPQDWPEIRDVDCN